MELIQLQMKLTPDILDVMQKRLKILRHISFMQPIGRRSLAQSLGMTERILRAEVDFLKQQGLIEVETIGMKLTNEGYIILQEVSPYIKTLFGLNDLEMKLQNKLQLAKVIIVPGNADEDHLVKKEMGKVAAQLVREYVQEKDVITLTGGSTVAEIANMMPEQPVLKNVLFLPARGGVGEHLEYLANTLVSVMAKKTGGSYRLLHVPDQLSEGTYHSLLKEEHIQEFLQVLRSARIVIHGIGEAINMAKRRNATDGVIELLRKEEAVGEAFGYYFNKKGKIVHKINTIGIQLEDLKEIPYIIAVAGGKSKAGAISAVLSHDDNQKILVTDEGAAREMLKQND